MIVSTFSESVELCKHILKAGRVPMVHGSPGQGKSSLAKVIAKAFNLLLIDIRLSTYDLSYLTGLPDMSGKRTILKPIDTFPLEGDTVPEGYKGWLILLDELPSVNPAIEAAAYRILLDREVGNNKLHPKCFVMGAGNQVGQGAIARKQGTATQTRMMHVVTKITAEEFVTYGSSIKMDSRVLSYINAKPDHLEAYNPQTSDLTYRNPRSWHMLSDVIKNIPDLSHKHRALLASAIGECGVMDFIAFTQVYDRMPAIKDLLADPEGVKFEDTPNVQYAITGALAEIMDSENAEAILKFLPRMGIEFNVLTLKMAIARNPQLRSVESVREWVTINAKRFM